MFKEFKEFAIKGNMVDLAIGVIIGGAFGKIVESLVKDVIMPPLGMLLGGIDFSNKVILLKKATTTAGAITLNYGLFINTVVSFIIISFSIFLVIKQINRFRRKEEPQKGEPALSTDQKLLIEIRDLLKQKNAS